MHIKLRNFDEYIPLAVRTKAPGDLKRDVLHAAMGISGEVSEILFAENRRDIANEAEECGDTCWYIAILCKAYGWSLQTMWEQSICFGPYADKDLTNIGILVVESGHFLDLVKKWEFYGKEFPQVHYQRHVQWILYCLNRRAIHRLETTLLELCERNIEKLAKRYGDKFTEFAALNRDLASERKVFEDPKQ